MPSVAENLNEWDALGRWKDQGEEWSVTWGGSEAQWFGTILPRLHAYLPAKTLVEIAPGFGRWTQYLTGYCEKLIAVDLSANCIDVCRKRFAGSTSIDYRINDGRTLPDIADRSVDLVFSFDSLVHVESDVIGAYLAEFARALSDDGVAFIHHSNAGVYRRPFALYKRMPYRFRKAVNSLNFDHWRAPSMTAQVFEDLARKAGLQCIGQEVVNWGGPFLLDCFSTVTRPESRWARPNRVVRNGQLVKEASLIAALAPLYSRTSERASR